MSDMTPAQIKEAFEIINATISVLADSVAMLSDTCKIQTKTIRDLHAIVKSLAIRLETLK